MNRPAMETSGFKKGDDTKRVKLKTKIFYTDSTISLEWLITKDNLI